MQKRRFLVHFIILFIPMFFVSALLNFVLTLNISDYIQMNWLIVILLAIILDILFTYIYTRKDKEQKPK